MSCYEDDCMNMTNSILNNDDDDDNDDDDYDGDDNDDGDHNYDDDDVCHCLFYTNLSSVVRKLSTAAKAFLPHRSGGRRLDNGQTERNLLLKMFLKVKIISHQIFLFPCLSVCRQSQRLLATFYGRLMRLPHFIHQRLLLQIHHTSHPFLC